MMNSGDGLPRLKIIMIASECVPYAKTGGLADVVGSLPKALHRIGHEVIVVMPLYAEVDIIRHQIQPFLATMGVWMGDRQEWCTVFRAENNGVRVYFIEHKLYFDRSGLYHDQDFNDYLDNPRRFGFLTRAALQLCHELQWRPDIVHAHDWQTALAAAYLKIWHWDDPILGRAASVLTIHNLAYQGVYSANDYAYLGLQWQNFTADKFESYGKINFLKGGIQYADMVNTVSPTYAKETRTPELGFGLAPYLNDKGDRYIGILNGVDYSEWNPEYDLLIPARYSSKDMSGKLECKQHLQARFWLNINPQVPVIGIVSRFVRQKGLDLLAEVIESILQQMKVQFVILGIGNKTLEIYLGNLPNRYYGQVGTYIGYNNELAHWIEAGADFLLMPSRYEPCGLNQVYSLRYGTLPIVRATGGLDDTVQQYQETSGAGTGFKFLAEDSNAIYYTTGWAVSTFYDRPEHMQQMIRAAMEQDFSWERSARQYETLYRKAIEVKLNG